MVQWFLSAFHYIDRLHFQFSLNYCHIYIYIWKHKLSNNLHIYFGLFSFVEFPFTIGFISELLSHFLPLANPHPGKVWKDKKDGIIMVCLLSSLLSSWNLSIFCRHKTWKCSIFNPMDLGSHNVHCYFFCEICLH